METMGNLHDLYMTTSDTCLNFSDHLVTLVCLYVCTLVFYIYIVVLREVQGAIQLFNDIIVGSKTFFKVQFNHSMCFGGNDRYR